MPRALALTNSRGRASARSAANGPAPDLLVLGLRSQVSGVRAEVPGPGPRLGMWGASIPPVFGAVRRLAFRDAFREAFGRFATGVCVVTSSGRDGPSGLTANAVTSLSLEPPLMIVCFDRESRTLPAVEHSGRFARALPRPRPGGARRPLRLQAPGGGEVRRARGGRSAPACRRWTAASAGLVCELHRAAPGRRSPDRDRRGGRPLAGEGDPLVFYRGDYWALTGREAAPPEVDEALEALEASPSRHVGCRPVADFR